jgi:uncharacterized protein with HEPN domain
MSRSYPIVFLLEMRDCANSAMSFIEGLDEASFMADERTKSATAMQLCVIGEAASKLARKHPGFAQQYGDLPWSKMVGVRNRVAHGYFDLNWSVIFEMTRDDLPVLIQRLNKIIESIETHGQS